jgi:hypothetical protein
MKRLIAAASILGLAALGAAQTPVPNEFHVYDGSVEFTSRGALADNEGEILQGVSGAHFGYLRTAVGMFGTIQDQNNSTAETYHLVIRKDDGTGKPDISPTGLIYMEGPYTYSGTGTGTVGSFPMRWTFQQPVPLPNEPFFYGIRIGTVPSPNVWPADGGSVHMSGGYPTRNVCGERPRLGVVPNLAWDVVYTAGQPASVAPTTLDRSYSLGLLFETALLQPYSIDPASACAPKLGTPDFGYAALWPDLTDLEKNGYLARIGWRVSFNSLNRSTMGYVFLSPVKLTNPILCPGVMPLGTGHFYLHPLGLLASGFVVTLNNGQALTPAIDLDPLLRIFLLGTNLYAQAVLIDSPSQEINFSNWTGTSL